MILFNIAKSLPYFGLCYFLAPAKRSFLLCLLLTSTTLLEEDKVKMTCSSVKVDTQLQVFFTLSSSNKVVEVRRRQSRKDLLALTQLQVFFTSATIQHS